jgi:hypothetical protein
MLFMILLNYSLTLAKCNNSSVTTRIPALLEKLVAKISTSFTRLRTRTALQFKACAVLLSTGATTLCDLLHRLKDWNQRTKMQRDQSNVCAAVVVASHQRAG